MTEETMTEGQCDLLVLQSIVKYIIIISSFPILTFFIMRGVILTAILGHDTMSTSANVYSAIAAVVVLHISLGLYIYKAYYMADNVKPEKKD